MAADPFVIGTTITAVASVAVGVLGYRRSKHGDTAPAADPVMAQIIDGYDRLVDNVQDDNSVLRKQLAACQRALAKCMGRGIE